MRRASSRTAPGAAPASPAARVSRALAILRSLALLALALALADFRLPLPTRARTLVLLIDVSASMSRKDVESARQKALSLLRGLAPRDRAAAAIFASGPLVISEPASPQSVARALESAELRADADGSTDLASALETAFSLAARGRGERTVVLLGDGRSNAGSPLPGPAASARAVPVIAVGVGARTAGVVARGLALPELARPGDAVRAVWRLDSDRPRVIDYELLVDGESAGGGEAELASGPNEVAVEIPPLPEGARAVELRARARNGPELPAAAAGAMVSVGAGASVLVVAGEGATPGEGASPIAAALRAQGMETVAGGAEALPEGRAGYAGYSAVVLDDLPALEMTESQQAALQDFVAGGGGLLAVGGDSSLGRGEYYATPLESVLPVETDERQRLFFTRAKLLFVIDHSGSMSETVGGSSKQLAAMRGVAAAIPELNPQDEVGIIGFDSTPAWILPFTPAAESALILDSLSLLEEGGGTDLAQAIEEIVRAFGDPEPAKRHAVILTDGLTPAADFRALASSLAASGVSMSTIGIGDEVNEELLKNIAEWSGGAYHRAELDQVPRIVDKETVRMTRDLMQEGDIAVRSSSDSPVVAGIAGGAGGRAPKIGGYLIVKAKSLATVLLEAESPQFPGRLDPLLAVWRYGNGRSAVFSSDSGRRWLSSWSGKPEYNRLWAQIVKEIERSGRSTGLRASAVVEGGNARLIVEALGADRRSLSGLRLVGRTSAAGRPRPGDGAPAASSRAFALAETASGRYEGYAPLAGPGLGAFEILDPTTGAWTSAWIWNPPGAELAGFGPDRASLAAIAEASGGRLADIAGLEAPPASVRWLSLPSRGFLAGLAIAFLLAELFLRSAMFGQLARAIASARAWIALQSSLAEALRRAPRSPFRIPSDEEDRIEMERRMRLAEHVARHVSASVSPRVAPVPAGPEAEASAGQPERRDG